MDKELTDALKSVLEDALQPIHLELKAIDQRLGGMDQRLGGMDQRLGGMDQRLGGMDQRLDGMDQRFVEIDQRFDKIDQRFVGMDQRFDSLESELKDFRAETKTALQVIQVGQRGTREEMTQRFNETQEGLNNLEADFKFVNHKTADHDLKFHRLESESKENRQ